jgi:NAD(P)-dependent dehydrogenase (short-subunit alcohol dehydrogenase family)
MKDPVVDPVAEVLLDFQSVMAQFLELQTSVIGAFAHGHRRTDAATALSPASPTALDPTSVAVAERVSPAAAVIAPGDAPADARPAAPAASPIQAASAAAPANIANPIVTAESDAAHSRYTLAIREREAGAARASLAPGHAVLVTDDGCGIGLIVADQLRREGRRVALVSPRGASDPARGLFVSALASLEEAQALVDTVRGSFGPIAALVHLAPLASAPLFARQDLATWSDRLTAETRALFLLTRALGPALEQAAQAGGAALIAATQMGGAFGAGDTADDLQAPTQGGVTGFTKCAAIEFPDVRVRALDLDPSEPIDRLATQILHELSSADSVTEIGYRRGRRVTLEAKRTDAVVDPTFVIPSDAVILATGGARGITAEVCLDLAVRYQPTFVLVGQSQLPPVTESSDTAGLTAAADVKRALMARLQGGGVKVTPAMVEKAYRQLLKEREMRETISRLSAAGARIHYVQLDVADDQAFGALIDDVYATYGRLDGVIHGAGVIEDKLIRDKAIDSFDRVFRTKAISAFVLARHIKPESLKFFVFFSSVAGRFGNRGQADYAAGNEVVSKLAVVLQRTWKTRVCAIAWAPWDKLGMVSPELKKEFARRGVELLSPAAGRRALWRELQQSAASDAEVVVGGHAATPIANDAPRETLPLLRHAMREGSQADAIRFARRLDPAVDFYLNDHRLDGKPVLPLAVATELMAQAAQAALSDLKVVAVRNLQLFKGIVVDPAPMSIVLTVRSAVHSNDEGLTEVDVDITTPGLAPPVRYRSVVQMAAREAEPPPFDPPAWPLAPLAKTVERAYADWTFHGPLFQRVTEIAGIGSDSMLGTIYAPTAAPVIANVGRPEWIIDPFVFDSALQLLLMWSRAQNDKTALPSRFHSFRRYGSLSDQPLTAYVAVESLAGGHALKSTVHFVNPTGAVVGVLEGMEASCTNALNRLAGTETSEGNRS